MIELSRGAADRLLHMKYKLRNLSAATISDDVVFPNDISIKRIKTPKQTDRVYEIAFNNSSKRMYVWSQEVEAANDEKHIKKLIETINSAEPAATRRPGLTANELERVMRSINFPGLSTGDSTNPIPSTSNTATSASAPSSSTVAPSTSTTVVSSAPTTDANAPSSSVPAISSVVATPRDSSTQRSVAPSSDAPIETMDLDGIEDEELRRALEMSLAEEAPTNQDDAGEKKDEDKTE